jgi:hypothetical protein
MRQSVVAGPFLRLYPMRAAVLNARPPFDTTEANPGEPPVGLAGSTIDTAQGGD